mmetsp:Transcript_23259/g.55225  ORF Transcript_23259/g.55225 Transcript_23259/m.55225 type:complete len:292 (-) Transcript_23259:1151-2026(-)
MRQHPAVAQFQSNSTFVTSKPVPALTTGSQSRPATHGVVSGGASTVRISGSDWNSRARRSMSSTWLSPAMCFAASCASSQVANSWLIVTVVTLSLQSRSTWWWLVRCASTLASVARSSPLISRFEYPTLILAHCFRICASGGSSGGGVHGHCALKPVRTGGCSTAAPHGGSVTSHTHGPLGFGCSSLLLKPSCSFPSPFPFLFLFLPRTTASSKLASALPLSMKCRSCARRRDSTQSSTPSSSGPHRTAASDGSHGAKWSELVRSCDCAPHFPSDTRNLSVEPELPTWHVW